MSKVVSVLTGDWSWWFCSGNVLGTGPGRLGAITGPTGHDPGRPKQTLDVTVDGRTVGPDDACGRRSVR